MATEKNYTPEKLRREAILILHKKLGALNTYLNIPELQAACGAGGHQIFAVGRKADGVNRA